MHIKNNFHNLTSNQTETPCETNQEKDVAQWSSRGYLPHFQAPGRVQHLVISLNDSLPRKVTHPGSGYTKLQQTAPQQSVSISAVLDQGRGACLLKNALAANYIQDSLLFGHPERYCLYAWVVMPNHVHALIKQDAHWPLGKVVSGWKRHTTKLLKHLPEASCYRRPDGRFQIWKPDYWDRYVRNSLEFEKLKRYIEANPVKAGLVKEPKLWRWSSAHL